MQGGAKIKVTAGGIYFYKTKVNQVRLVLHSVIYVLVIVHLSTLNIVVMLFSNEDNDINNY